ncbi:polymorphic toxin-type HINT domain-containing protein [Kitasatospora sp. NPDC088346]|uniref:polymorphic toxin-type HINT domain-containing protein n=1 Tax=Kitasatospora sp. NPDC088346 TaxID=3364073 RepID=UPI003821243F
MGITRKQRARRRSAVGITVGGLLAALLATPAAADTAPPIGPVADRVAAVAAWKAGGPAVKRAAEMALVSSDNDVKAFLTSGQGTATEQDLRSRVEELIAASGPRVREAAKRALGGSASDVQAFVDTGYRVPLEDDQRLLLSQIMSVGGPRVRGAAGRALDGSIADVREFLNSGQYLAQEDDDRLKLSQLMSTGGSEVKKAAGAALDGSVDDVREFLRYGYQTAAAHDQETLTIAQLADLTHNAADQAGTQAKTAGDAAARALDASALAKQAAERAAAETKAARGEAKNASNAAGKAADAAERAAKAAQAASAAAANANEAARQAADAAADAGRASALAGEAAAQAQAAAARASVNKDDAAKARDAAVAAKKAAADAKTAGEAAQWAIHASSEAGEATEAAKKAGDNADAAAAASLEAASQSGVSGEAADRARAAADRAKTAGAEARRASAATTKIAADAKAAATEAQRASSASAVHAEAAAAAAEQAAAHAGDAATAAAGAQAAATAAQAAAETASSAATQAHTVADIARASDAERLAAQQAAEVAAAQQAYFEEAAKAKQAAWESGKATALAADTQRLITEATAAGVDQNTAVAKGRLAATRLLTAGGPWTQIAAQTALEGHDGDVLAFLSADLALGRERDDRSSVNAIADASTKLEQRLAAETASVGSPDQVRAFLATGQYPGKDDDDRLALSKIMSSGGLRVREAAGKALDGTIDDVRTFLTTGQYSARDDDNRLLISQAMSAGGPEVQAATQAAMSGPTSGLATFLAIGLPKARQRDAVTAAHVATVASYLQAIDGNTALARQYAAQAAQSYATAYGASSEADRQANQAQASATEAADWAAKAAESARQAKASADQAVGYATQARTAAASAATAARQADFSATAAESFKQKALDYASEAEDAKNKARASAIEAGKSAEEAQRAATEAFLIASKRMQDDSAATQSEAQTTIVSDDGRVSFIQSIARPDVQYKIVKDNSEDVCSKGYNPWGPGGRPDVDVYGPPPGGVSLGPWHKDASGTYVCDFKATVKITGTFDYYLRTCPEANLTIAQCNGKYATWDVLQLAPQTVDTQVETTLQAKWGDWRRAHTTSGLLDEMGAQWWGGIKKCFTADFWTVDTDCAGSVAMVIPVTDLIAAGKVVLAYRVAVETGIGIESATAAVTASLGTIKGSEALAKINAATKAINDIRAAMAQGRSTDEAMNALKSVRNADPTIVRQMENEIEIAAEVRTNCVNNSFPAGTAVVMADGSSKAIESITIGDYVGTIDPVTHERSSQQVTGTFAHATASLVRIQVDGSDVVESTPGHPFYIDQAGWREASNLRVGDELLGADGRPGRVTALERVDATPQRVFDLSVAGTHMFMVKSPKSMGPGVVVHNCFDLWYDEQNFPPAHTLKKHVAKGPYGPNGEFAGVTAQEAQNFATAAEPRNGVFDDYSIAMDALKQAIDKKTQEIGRWAGDDYSSNFKEFEIGVDVIRDGSRLPSLGKVYKYGGSSTSPASAGTKVRVRLVKADKHNKKKWYVSSIFPLEG